MSLLTLKIQLSDEHFEVEYDGVDECLRDDGLKVLMGTQGVIASIWCGDLKVSSKSISSWEQLKQQLVSNSSTILRQYL